MKSPQDAAREFWSEPRGCTCASVDIGPEVLHEPHCGMPSPDDLAEAFARRDAEHLQEREYSMRMTAARALRAAAVEVSRHFAKHGSTCNVFDIISLLDNRAAEVEPR